MQVLITHPSVGSVWMCQAKITGEYVTGQVLDRSEVGSKYLPDDYNGQYIPMTFPISCIKKKEGK